MDDVDGAAGEAWRGFAKVWIMGLVSGDSARAPMPQADVSRRKGRGVFARSQWAKKKSRNIAGLFPFKESE